MGHGIEWTDDCQGKKDYDGELVFVSTRYWPRGGGYHLFNTHEPEKGFRGNDSRPDVKPSAKSTIYFRAEPEDIVLVEKDFEGETQEEVQRAVEEWVERRYMDLEDLLVDAFRESESSHRRR